MSKLLQVLALLYRMTEDDVSALENELTQARKREWRLAITELIHDNGCRLSARNPSGGDLAELRAMSKEDAKSIAATYNRDLERQLTKLYEANPRGNRAYYIKHMETWALARAAWKNPQISLMTAQQTRWFAQNRYRAMNGLRGNQYIFVGPAAVCKKCLRLFAAGVVSEAFIQRHPAPVHINCPHEWRMVGRQRIPCDELWIG